ncbi:MAG: ElyC/SanA/YdcF family protein [Bacteroidales bacterium]
MILLVSLTWLANRIIEQKTNELIFANSGGIPHNRVGLLLGTSKYLKSGKPNQYFSYRILAAVELYKAGKINYVVISGDNSQSNYNEPLDMKDELVAHGIPENRIYLDYAGFRTYDSVIRMDKIFGQKKFTVISQEFHTRRAVYIGNRLGLEPIGYNARDVDAYNGFKTKLREKLARVKVFVDFLIHKEPKFLGQPIEIK